ncbi:hypothetical protein M569_08061, partial [Genlisea aurea]
RNPGSDFQYLFDYLKKRQAENPSFFYEMEDDNDLSGNVFWADSASQSNYCYFGDTIRLHTSYRTNRSKLPIVTFTGLNHHAQPVPFGCAFLLNESDNTFIWLLESFLRAVSERSPLSITCDPDRDIQMVVSQVLPDTRLRFCRWSIFRQTREKMGSVFQANPALDFELRRCVNEADTVEEFESSWSSLMSQYFLMDDEWLQSLYRIRDQWVPVYLKDVFYGELSTAENVDPFGQFFGMSATTSMPSLVKQYEQVVSSCHETELKDDFDTYNATPVLKTPSPMEKQAADLYTRTVFVKFQGELVEALANPATVVDDTGTTTAYRVEKFGEEQHEATQHHIVRFDEFQTKAAGCSCRMFDFSGIVCRHILSVFMAKNVLILPPGYVLKRWTRNAKSSSSSSSSSSCFQESGNVLLLNHLRQEGLKYVEQGSKSIQVYNVAMNALRDAQRRVAAVRSRKSKETTNAQVLFLSLSFAPSFMAAVVMQEEEEEEKKRRICEMKVELARANEKCAAYRAILQSLFKDVEEHKLKLSVKVQNARLCLKD